MKPTRRGFLGAVGAALAATSLGAAEPRAEKRKRLCVVTTVWAYGTHAWHMAERFLVGYPRQGRWHRPAIDVVSAYVDQLPKGDLSARGAKEFGFEVYPSVAEALRCGGDKLEVDGVLLIGEHGDYPMNEFGQKLYPRYELFQQIVDVYRRDGRTAPVFNDKHLSWNFDYAKEMVAAARELKFPLQGGSSLPVTWRMPAIDLPPAAEVEEALCLAMGVTDIYDFHALEALQSFVERRRGGETGVAAVQAVRGEAVWKLLDEQSGAAERIDSSLFEACLAQSQTLKQPESFSHRRPTLAEMREWVKDPIAYRLDYRDGLRATMLLMNGLVQDFTVAARVKGAAEPISTMYYLPENPNVAYSAPLMSHAETMFMTGRAVYPIERTLLTSGLVQACLQSLKNGQTRLETPHLDVSYRPTSESTFARS